MKKSIFLVFFFLNYLAILYAYENIDTLKEQVCAELPKIGGWCSKEKALHFIDLVIDTHPQVCVEIGVFQGASLFPVASALKFLGSGVIIGIDPWDRFECIKHYVPGVDDMHINWWTKLDLESIYMGYLNMLKRYGLNQHCVTIRTTSQKAINQIAFIDILYIDGNHGESAYTQDVMFYLPKVSSGGYIWINDTLNVNAQEAISILLDHCDFVKIIDNGNCILFRKR